MSSGSIKALAVAARAAKAVTKSSKADRILTYDELLRGTKSVPQTLDDIPEQLVSQIEATRLTGISDTLADTKAIVSQTINESEFKERLLGQLDDPDYAAKNTLQIDEVGDLGEIRVDIDAGYASPQDQIYVNLRDSIEASKKQHKFMVSKLLGPLNDNIRWREAAKSWWGDSPYKNDLQFHVDRTTDPTRPHSFIQFESPQEFGLHSGTNKAAQRMVGRGGIEEIMKNQMDQNSAIELMASEIGLSVKEVGSTISQALDRYLISKFTKNKDYYIWDQVEEMIDVFVDAFGADARQIGQFMQGIKDMPTPSTTPFLFRGKNGLLLEDEGGFKSGGVSKQLDFIFNNEADRMAIDIALGALGEVAKQKELMKFMETKGFDHIIYYNAIEDQGSLSIINWNEDLMISPWASNLHKGPHSQAKAASAYILGVLGLGGADAIVRDEE